MLNIRNLSNMFQKRLIRPVLAQTQGTPYPGVLDPSLRNTDGSFRAPLSSDVTPVARSANAFVLQGGLVPGTVMVKSAGDSFVVATGAATSERPFGLLGNFVGGTLDDLRDNNEIGVWYGPGSVYELLAPAFNDGGLAAAYAAATPGQPVLLYAGADGRLAQPTVLVNNNATNKLPVAELVERSSAAKIVVKLLV
jgi:hypothetical protein